MNILILNTFDSGGGAAIATYRLHNGLRAIGVNSQFLAQKKNNDDVTITAPVKKWQIILASLKPYMDGIFVKFYRNRPRVLFSTALIPDLVANKVAKINPDFVHLFWVNGGFLQINTLEKFKKPVIWTLHDMWPLTGGCHYDDECRKFEKTCGACPALNSQNEHDLSNYVLQRKLSLWKDLPITVVATSNWLADMARSSAIFKNKRVEVIPNGIDTDVYKPCNKDSARLAYNLPKDKQLILFSAFSATSDKRKGNQFLVKALAEMVSAGWGNKAEIVIVGSSKPENPPDFGMKIHYMGILHDEVSQVLLYSAADVVVAPSMQENLSNTVMESMSCGTPVVAFDIGGMPDMIDHKWSGYLVKPFDIIDLAKGIVWILENNNQDLPLSNNARQTVLERFTLKMIANRYMHLYQNLSA